MTTSIRHGHFFFYSMGILFALCCPGSLKAQVFIDNVNILDVERQRILPSQTIEIINDRIARILPSNQIQLNANDVVINATGQYLLPGLVDAHIHFSQSGGLYTRPDAINLTQFKSYETEIKETHDHYSDRLRRYIQAGITTVIDVGTTYSFLLQRDTFVHRPDVPSVFMSGPLITTYEPDVFKGRGADSPFTFVSNTEEARQAVQNQMAFKPDLIKIWYIVQADSTGKEAAARELLPIVKATIEEAHQHNLKVAVHAPERIVAQLAVESGCDYLVHCINDEIISPSFVSLLKQNDVIVCPTLIVHDGYVKTFSQTIQCSDYELRMADPLILGTLTDLRHLTDTALVNAYKRYARRPEVSLREAREDSICRLNLKLLSDGGVMIATGTDAGNIGTLHAVSYQAEVMAMHASGMSEWDILTASTINGAKVVSLESEFGSIAKGKKANLLLLDGNPTEDLNHLFSIDIVILNGQVINPDTLIRMTPEDVVQQRINAINFGKIEAVTNFYDDNIEIVYHPDLPEAPDLTDQIFDSPGRLASHPDIHVEVMDRSIQGSIVTAKERYTSQNFMMDFTVIYHVNGNKIKRIQVSH